MPVYFNVLRCPGRHDLTNCLLALFVRELKVRVRGAMSEM